MLILLFRLAPYIGAGLVGAFLGFQMGKPIHYREGYAQGQADKVAEVNRSINKTEGMIDDQAKAAERARRDAAMRMCLQYLAPDDPSACAE